MIIIEGTDLLGKTTLAKALEHGLNAVGLPFVYRHLSKLGDAFPTFTGYLPMLQDSMQVLDRMYLSRQAYGQACGNQALLTPYELSVLDAHVVASGGFVVVVTAEERLLQALHAACPRSEMYGLDQIQAANRAYIDMCSREGRGRAHWDIRMHMHYDPVQRRQACDCTVNDWDQLHHLRMSGGQPEWPSAWVPAIQSRYLIRHSMHAQLAAAARAVHDRSWRP